MLRPDLTPLLLGPEEDFEPGMSMWRLHETVEATFFSSLDASLVMVVAPLARTELMLQALTSSKAQAAKVDWDDSWMDRHLLSPFTKRGDKLMMGRAKTLLLL